MKRIAAAIGLEGAFLALGTALLAAASSFISPAGPFLVSGVMCIVIGADLALHSRRA